MSVSLRHASNAKKRPSSALDLKIELLRSLTILFSVDQNISQESIDHYENSYVRISDHLDADIRLTIAQLIVHLPYTPETVIEHLASGQDDAAHYTLRYGTKVSSSRLMAAAAWQSISLAQCVAQRTDLDEDIIRILAERPERAIVHTLVENKNLTFDKATLTHIQRRARYDQHLAQCLAVVMNDKELLSPLFLAADSNKRRSILLEARRKYVGKPLSAVEADEEAVDNIAVLTDMNLVRPRLSTILEKSLSCSPEDASRIINDREGEPLALCAAWMGCEPDIMAPIFDHLLKDHAGGQRHRAYLLDIVRQVPFIVADDLLRSMLTSPLRQRAGMVEGPMAKLVPERKAQSWHIPARKAAPKTSADQSTISRK